MLIHQLNKKIRNPELARILLQLYHHSLYILTKLNYDWTYQIGLAEDVRSKLEIAEPDRKRWQEICKAFLKGSENQRQKYVLNTEEVMFS